MRTEGVKGAIGKPPCRARRRDSPCNEKNQETWKCSAKGRRGRPQSPLVAPAGAIPPATRKIKKHGSAVRRGVGGDRKAPDSPPQRRNLLQQKRPASGKQIVSHTGRSRPSGATICEWSNVQLEGAPAGARSYWQGRFAACTFVGRVLHTGRPRNGWGVAPNPTRDAVP